MPADKITARAAIKAAAALVREAEAQVIPATFETKTIKCSRCNGTGAIAAYAHNDNGRCMGCGGSGRKTVDKNKAEADAARKAALLAEITLLGKARAEAVKLLKDVDHWEAASALATHQTRLDNLRAQYVANR